MCGIVGAWRHEAIARLPDAVHALAHRGPDDAGTFVDETAGIALGHTRLAILDLSPAGHQPMASADGDVVLVYNGEIYNFRELRAQLEGQGERFIGHSDTEVLLALYRRHGADLLQMLNGIFAFAIYDRARNELLIARDGLGVKPLYVLDPDDGAGIAFASELKALAALLPGMQWALDEAALHRYATYLWCPGSGTPARQVRKLEPGSALLLRDGKQVRAWRWYALPAQRGISGRGQPGIAPQAVATALRAAVQRQLVADVPVGAFLSGGLDSSAVVAFAREQAPGIRCFTIATPGGRDAGEADDLPYARRAATHLGVQLDVVEVDAQTLAGDLQAMVAQLDEPLADPAPLNVFHISRLARRHGIRVLLSGAGGDDLFTGYRRHRALQLERWWSGLPKPARGWMASGSMRFDQRGAFGRRIARAFAHADLDPDARLAGYFAWNDDVMLRTLYSPGMRQAVADVRADAPLRDFLGAIPQGPDRLERMLALEQRFFLADHNLLYTDKMSMAAGVEVRVPFLDPELVELAARIPSTQKQRGATGKAILKQAMEPWLPREVIYRPKTGFGAPLRRWMRHELRELLGEVLNADALRRRGLFEPAAVQALIADNDAGRRDGAYALLSLLCIELWCRQFIDRAAVPGFRQAPLPDGILSATAAST